MARQTYCGNNALNSGLINGTSVIGTRYGCLRKGIGVGLHLPIDLSYLGPYIPIDNTRSYCGNNPVLPAGYDRFGSCTECLRKGVGVGKGIAARRSVGGGRRREKPKRKSKKKPKRKSKSVKSKKKPKRKSKSVKSKKKPKRKRRS
jgi:hypothetical protein